jgi:hypothetical protein
MLADPIVRAIMAADGVRAGKLEMLERSAANGFARPAPKTRRGDVEEGAVE